MREIELTALVSASVQAGLQDSVPTRASCAMSTIRGVAILRLSCSMDPAEFAKSREAFLRMLVEGRHKVAVVDAAAVDALDNADAEELRNLLVAVSLVGAAPHLCGLQPGVAAILASRGPKFLHGVRVLRDLDEAMEPVRTVTPAHPAQRPSVRQPPTKRKR
jgi:anti-anti-sigma regulatory factor